MVRILKEDVFLGDVTGELRPPLSTQDQNMEVSNHRDKENNNCCSNNIDNFNTSQGERERADSPELRNGGGGPGEDFDEVMSTDSIVSSEGGGFTFRVPIIIVGDFEEEEEESEEDSEDNHESNSQEVRKRKLIPPTVVIQNVDDEQSTRFNEYIEEMNPEGGGRDEETGKGEIMTSIEQETIKPPQEQENVICSHANVVTQDSSTKSLETNNEGKIDPVEKSMDEQGDHHDDKDKESEEDCAHAAKDSKEPETPISSTTSSLSSVSNSSRAAVLPLSSKGSSSSSSHGQARFNRGHHHQHHCPAFHRSMHLPPNNQVPQVVPNIHFMMTQAHQSAMNHLINQTPFQHSSNFQNFPLLPNPPVSVQPPPPPPPLPPHSQQHGGGPFILGPPPNFSRNCPHHQNRPPLLNHNIIKPLPPPQTKYQPRHNHHPSQNRASLIQRQNINPMMNTAVPMHLFGEPEIPPWGGSFPNSNNRPPPPPSQPPSQIPSLPPLDIQGSSGTLPLIGSLPTAIIPLPLDRNFPPVVLPSYPNNTNTPNTQSTSGYSTAGHSRSSSPMGPTVNHGHGLLQHFDNGLLPLPPPPPNSQQANGCTNLVFSAPFQEHAMYPQFFPHSNGQFVVYFHINLGVSVSFTTGDQSQVVKGPMTVPLVSTNSSAPIPLPMQVPPNHIVQQIVDENGTLRHVIVSHQPPLIPIPNYNPNSQGGQFYPAGPSGPFQSAHYSPMQPVPCPVPSPHQQGGGGPPMSSSGYQSSIPLHVAQKDERTQRQLFKLRRKFEQKQQGPVPPNSYNNNNGSSYNNQSSIRKAETAYPSTNGNGTRKVTNGVSKSPANGGIEEDGSVGSTGSVTSTGTQDEEEERSALALTEMLSSIIPPSVTEVAARSSHVQWSHPDRISESGENKFPDFDVADTDFRYEVFINEKSRDARFRSIFVGSALSCRVKDLKPGSLYAITYCAMLGESKGNTCPPTNFTTLPAEPDVPGNPRAVSRSRSSIQLKWNPPATDNGSKINYYLLEYDEGKGGNHFVEAYRGKNKQCTVSKLQPAYSYQFRLAAINDYGKSRYTNSVNAMTAGSPPPQPSPPTVAEAGVKYLRLEWKGRDTDDEYTLQMDDPSTGHGYLAMYNGSAPNYLCIGLTRNSQYKFRLRAQNEEGHSKWSEEVVICTLPDRPGPPHKPGLKGRVHAYGFRVRWDPPSDTGGVPVQAYALEIDQGNGYEEIYRGHDTECTVDRLSPGQSYALRVIAIGVGGGSDPSESCVITTEPVGPGKCHIPRIMGKPKSNSVHLKWNPPDWTGGSPINMYEVGCTTPDNLTQEAYRGKETECIVNRLLPGRAYLFQIRAFNRIGAGEWSDPLEVVSGAGSPDAPSSPKVSTKTSHIVLISWTEPCNNGSAVTEYRVQMAMPATSTQQESPSAAVVEEVKEDGEDGEGKDAKSEIKETVITQQQSSFTQVYIGSSHACEVKGLQPASLYMFRVQALNSAGGSDWSPVVSHEMPASSPNGVLGVEASTTSSSISLSWRRPSDNGSSITHYNIMMGETLLVADPNPLLVQDKEKEVLVLEEFMPDTQYKIRVQAVNSVGPGPFSSSLKVSTKPLAPLPPKLECVAVAHFWMKLKWSEISSKNIEYLVQMINPYKDEFEVVYRGIASNCKVQRLNEDTEYQFRICALNGAGQGPFSDLYRFSTSKSPPAQVKGCKTEFLKDSKTHRFEWFEVICSDTIEYQFQIACKKRDMDFKTMYRGIEKRVELNHDDLEEGVDYACRVCAIRVCGDGQQLVGPYSNNVNFHIPLPSGGEDSSPSKSHSVSSKSPIKVSTTFITTVREKMSRISYESRVGMMAVLALIIVAFFISLITHHVVS